jgi:hypothetical protein
MKRFAPHVFSIQECVRQLAKLERLLSSKPILKEREDILPFFEENVHLAAYRKLCS